MIAIIGAIIAAGAGMVFLMRRRRPTGLETIRGPNIPQPFRFYPQPPPLPAPEEIRELANKTITSLRAHGVA